MEIKVLDWHYKNIRGLLDLKVSVKKDKSEREPFPVTLVMMPNGTGKTTTINLMRAVFDGSAQGWGEEDVKSYKPRGSRVENGHFGTTLRIDGQIYKIFLHLDYEGGKAFYKTAKVGEIGGLDSGHLLPEKIKNVLTQEFVKRFVFNGELATLIIKSESDEAEKAMKYLYQISDLLEFKNRVDILVEEFQSSRKTKTSTKTEVGLNKLKKDRDFYKNRLKVLIQRKEEKIKIIENKKNQLKEVEEKIDNHMKSDENLGEQVEDIDKKIKKVREDIVSKTTEIKDLMRSPYLFSERIHNRLRDLSEKMQKLQLPKTMSKQFFEELAEQIDCICGRKHTPETKNTLTERAKQFLGEDQIGIINSIKSAIRGVEVENYLIEKVNELSKLNHDNFNLKTQMSRLQQKRVDEGDLELENLKNKKEKIIEELNMLHEQLEELTTEDKEKLRSIFEKDNIFLCNKELEEAEEKLNQATDTVNLAKRKGIMENYIDTIASTALSKIKNRVIQKTNSKISKFIQSEKLEVEGIDGYLRLKGKGGASEGQSLALAYAFLGSMFESSTYNLPFIVDSPAGSLDLEVRRQVSQTIPDLFDQLIVFITSGEREGFADYFYDFNGKAQFLTIPGDGNNCIYGFETFQKFQSNDEG